MEGRELMTRMRVHSRRTSECAEGSLNNFVSRLVLLVIAITLCFQLISGKAAFGQTDQGAITGLVVDAASAVIPGAQVTLTSVDTGLVLQTVTSASGNYTFSPVKIGNYRVEVKSSGFRHRDPEQLAASSSAAPRSERDVDGRHGKQPSGCQHGSYPSANGRSICRPADLGKNDR